VVKVDTRLGSILPICGLSVGTLFSENEPVRDLTPPIIGLAGDYAPDPAPKVGATVSRL
jgi:hypothetical protein